MVKNSNSNSYVLITISFLIDIFVEYAILCGEVGMAI